SPTPPIEEETEPIQSSSEAMIPEIIGAAHPSDRIPNVASQLTIQRINLRCQSCGADMLNDAAFCRKCGTSFGIQRSSPMIPVVTTNDAQIQVTQDAHPVFARAAQMFGLHPIVAFATFAIDIMLFGEEAASLMVGWVIAIPVALVLGVGIVFCQ